MVSERAKITKQLHVLRSQAEMLAYDEEWGAARGGTRAGKSFGFALWLFFKRIQPYPYANHVVVGADYEQLRRGYFDLMVGLLESIGWQEGIDYKYRDTPRPRITFLRLSRNGQTCVLQSLSTRLVERIRGMSIQTLLLEEPQTWGTKAKSGDDLYALLVGRFSHSQMSAELYPDMLPQGRMSFNPPAEGSWLHELVENKWKARGWKCWRMSVVDNHLLVGKDRYIEGLKTAWNPKRWPSEIEGHWQTAGGNCYYGFDATVHGHPPDGIPPVDLIDEKQPLLWSLDFNVAFMASVVAQPFNQRRCTKGWIMRVDAPPREQFAFPVPTWQHRVIRAIGEIVVQDGGAPDVAREFIARYGDIARRQGIVLFGDVSGNQRSQSAEASSAARTNWMAIGKALTEAKIPWGYEVGSPGKSDPTVRHAPSVDDRINEVNNAFGTGDGYGVTIDLDACPVLVKDFREVERDSKGNIKKPKDTKLTHMSDAWGYLVHRQREIARERNQLRRQPDPVGFMGR